MDQMHISQYDIQIANGAKQDTGKSTATKASLEEALSIQRAHSQYRMAAYALTILASAHMNLRIFDGARSTLKEALETIHTWIVSWVDRTSKMIVAAAAKEGQISS